MIDEDSNVDHDEELEVDQWKAESDTVYFESVKSDISELLESLSLQSSASFNDCLPCIWTSSVFKNHLIITFFWLTHGIVAGFGDVKIN